MTLDELTPQEKQEAIKDTHIDYFVDTAAKKIVDNVAKAQLAKDKGSRPSREKMAKSLMVGLGKMLGMPSVPEWDSLADYLKKPYRVFADQILALDKPKEKPAVDEEVKNE